MNGRAISVLAAAAVIAGGTSAILVARPKGDRDVVDATVQAMSEAELAPPAKPQKQQNPPALTAVKVRAIVEALKDPEAHNGIVGIAFELGVSPEQVRMVKRRVERRLAELAEQASGGGGGAVQ